MTRLADSGRRPTLPGLAGLLFIALAALGSPAVDAAEVGTIVAARLNVRPGPGTDNEPLMIVRKGAVVDILDHDRGWVKIAYRDRTGWVKNREIYIRIEKADEGPEADTDAGRAREEAETIQRRIAAGQEQVAAFGEEELRVVESLDGIDFALHQARGRRRELESQIVGLSDKIAASEKEVQALTEKIEASRAYAVRRLVALYKLDRIGRIHFLASAETVYEAFLRETALERVLTHDRAVLTALADNRAERQRLLQSLREQRQTRTDLGVELKARIEELAAGREKRGALLEEIRNKKSMQLAALEALRRSAEELDEKINALDFQGVRSEPTFDLPKKPFADLKGLLKMPVEGKIVSSFGPYRDRHFNVKNFRSGIDIRADRGEPIRAVCVGKVVYADWFKGYGNMMIINHGGSYHTVYANIEELFKSAGDRVQAGEVVATVGDAGSEIGPKLYFEIRFHGKPVDPVPWMGSG